ncbi:TetR/AcrR family transcriptional regulator [Deinococcus petrolearius]|uniref:TetR/AcrR family transcriptional regulator n=1 Tax=Deinococcus petrolearius TaxID=1751295 RepID=A0ABW1DK57_9DEIO
MKKATPAAGQPKNTAQGLAFPARRQPTQARSRRMVERLLDAAGQVFMAEGFGGATTNRVAEVAGVSVGSLYQFFPNKLTLLAELQRRWTARLGAELDVALADPHRPLADLIDEVLGVHARVQRASDGLLGFLLTERHHLPLDLTVRDAVRERLEHMAALRRPGSAPAHNRRAAQMTIHIADALYVKPGGPTDPHLRAQVRQALLGYLSLALEEPPTTP